VLEWAKITRVAGPAETFSIDFLLALYWLRESNIRQ
jgi:hypothetical protein